LYIALLGILGGIILWAKEPIDYMNGLFVATSALCVTGLSSVDFSTFSTGSQVLVLIWIQLGGLIFVSLFPLIVRLFLLLWNRRNGTLESHQRNDIRILTIVVITVASYILVIQAGAFITIGSYLEANSDAGDIVDNNGVRNYNKWFWALFYTVSAFQNAGFGLFGASMIPFAANRVVTLTLAFLILAGYNLYPIFIRIIFFCESKLLRGKNREAVETLLKESRLYYYLLFPFRDSLKMFAGFLCITTIEYAIFFVEWNRLEVYGEAYGAGTKLMVNFFQVVSIRNCGMNNVNIGSLLLGHLSLIVLTMYISAFPFIVTVKKTRTTATDKESTVQYTVKRLLIRDLVWLYLAVMIICLVEQKRSSTDPTFILDPYLAVVFEVSSAFGTVGLSLGVPGQNYSYSGILSRFSKFVIICVFFCGRHRGLPDSIDPAVSIKESGSRPDIQMKEIGSINEQA